MRALTVRTPHQVGLEDRPDPVAAPGEMLIAPMVVGMCGTDLDIIDGVVDPAYVAYPIVLGHEWAGRVVTGAAGVEPGTRVVVEGLVPCGHCAECAAGATNRCLNYDEFGFNRDGAAADLLVAPARLVHPLSEEVSWESGALVEPAAVVYRALDRANPAPGARVLVVGDGTVALLAARIAQLWEPATVTMLGARPAQAALAGWAGVELFTCDPAEAGAGYDLVVEAAGAAAATAAALSAPARGGTVIVLGFPGQGVTVPLAVDDLVNGDVTVAGSFSYTSDAWASVVRELNSGRLELGSLVTHRFPLSRYAAAIEALRHPVGARGKVLIDMGS
ncbi:MAG TPA: alcohol dehydrogenase catalytic domain-containing protein [Gaiellales bacterium]|nr:alcohol dehydrogenase catalytic domain-containing protein [Gaiellales bacterium]